MSRNADFISLLSKRWQEANSLLCIGLDPDIEKLPRSLLISVESSVGDAIFAFNKAIIDATVDLVCCYKPQFGHYAACGISGLLALKNTIEYVHDVYPEIPVLLDAKRSDISSTAAKYAVEVFDVYGADAVTLHAYFGREANRPYLERKDKGLFFLCHTSNPGAEEFQELKVRLKRTEELDDEVQGELVPLYVAVAYRISHHWNMYGNCGLVVGAPYPQKLSEIRRVVGDKMPILVPGIGAQGGEIGLVVKAGTNADGNGLIISASRSITYASCEADFAPMARHAAQELRDAIRLA